MVQKLVRMLPFKALSILTAENDSVVLLVGF